jgi:signal peptidase II
MSIVTSWFRKAWLVLVVAGIVILLDQWTKTLIRISVPEYTAISPIPALGDYLLFEHVRNYGAAFGMLQNQGGFFIIVAVIVAVGILFYVRYLPTDQWVVRVLLGLMLGGAVGNVIDRFQQGYVTDFVKVGIPGVYYWPNFNVADSAIVLGVIGLGIYVLVHDVRRQREQKAATATATEDRPATTTDPNRSDL